MTVCLRTCIHSRRILDRRGILYPIKANFCRRAVNTGSKLGRPHPAMKLVSNGKACLPSPSAKPLITYVLLYTFFLKRAMDFHLFKKYFMNSPTMRQSGKYVCAALLPA